MPVVAVGRMGVSMPDRRVKVTVAVRLAGRIVWTMDVAMVFVVNMTMAVLDRLVNVRVLVSLGQV